MSTLANLKMVNNNDLFKELISKQLKNISSDKKFQFTDIKRICKYINTSIFNEQQCCMWSGYVTNINNLNKGAYINFYFRKKKAALHRLLYINFIGDLSVDEYLKFSCENKGICCNIHHLKKFTYQKKHSLIKQTKYDKEKVLSTTKNSVFIINRATATQEQLNKLIVEFD
jgi:hypothetical protein